MARHPHGEPCEAPLLTTPLRAATPSVREGPNDGAGGRRGGGAPPRAAERAQPPARREGAPVNWEGGKASKRHGASVGAQSPTTHDGNGASRERNPELELVRAHPCGRGRNAF